MLVMCFFLLFGCAQKQIYNKRIGELLNSIQQNLEVGICFRYFGTSFHEFIVSRLCSTYLLPLSKVLQMKDDSRNASYIENLIEKYVTNYDYVAQILIKVGNHERLHC